MHASTFPDHSTLTASVPFELPAVAQTTAIKFFWIMQMQVPRRRRGAPIKLARMDGVGENVMDVKGDGEHPLEGPHLRKCK